MPGPNFRHPGVRCLPTGESWDELGYNEPMLCTFLCLALPVAQAAPGHYHPEDIAASSTLMARASEGLTTSFDARAKALRRVAISLQDYREALDLLGSRAPAAERERLDALEKQYHREEAVLQAFADEIITDFDTVMGGAMNVALAKFPEAERCRAEIEVPGPKVPGMRSRTKANPDCTGEDLNAEIAKAMDAFPTLNADIDEILALEWPTVTVDATPQTAVGEGVERWVHVRALTRATAKPQLAEISREDDLMRLEIDAALEGDQPDLEALKTRVAEIERTTGASRATLGSAVLGAADIRLAKKKAPATGWCANPATLGGCSGPDATRDVVSALTSDRKFDKALQRALR